MPEKANPHSQSQQVTTTLTWISLYFPEL